MNRYHAGIFLFLFAINHICGYGQDFSPKNQTSKIRAYSVPLGTTTLNNVITANSKTYKITTPQFDKAVKLSIFQSDYDKAANKQIDHLLYEKSYKQGESMFFSVVINEEENKYHIFVPGSFIGQLHFSCDKNERIRYVRAETASNNSFLFYIDSDKDDIEAKIGKYKQDNTITNDSDLNQVLLLLNRFYMIHYKYE